MEETIEDLLTLAHEGSTVSERERIDVTTSAAEAWKSFSCPEITPDDERSADGDAARLWRSVENLLRSAIDHTATPVTAKIGRPDGGFYVADDGSGIDEGRQGEILESEYTTADDETGSGLSIVERITDAHHWGVMVADSNTGGARFEFLVSSTTQQTPTVAWILRSQSN